MGDSMRTRFEKEDHSFDANSIQELSDLHDDKENITIIFFLYMLQGIPLGLYDSWHSYIDAIMY